MNNRSALVWPTHRRKRREQQRAKVVGRPIREPSDDERIERETDRPPQLLMSDRLPEPVRPLRSEGA